MNAGYTSHVPTVTSASKVFDGTARGFEHAWWTSFQQNRRAIWKTSLESSFLPLRVRAVPKGNCANFLMWMLSKANLVALGNRRLPNCYFFKLHSICLTCNINFQEVLLFLSSRFVKISILIFRIDFTIYKWTGRVRNWKNCYDRQYRCKLKSSSCFSAPHKTILFYAQRLYFRAFA